MARSFTPGDNVVVRAEMPNGHCRTPHYLRARRGEVVSILGRFPNPEQLAYYQNGDLKTLYEVRFRPVDLWDGYQGPPGDTVVADIYEHWLEPSHG